ncbi:TRAP-type C4-dicarboxylate transport system permease small subunit [Natranaerovirga hydrolytica]|uniref:TRAP-type C4-dicarboxylate transport system permease small subunit n=1 Tax=Natranaerovirga hydrolytica TaxID=680378 RepID=A0A4R1MZI7_9FIRM|nr:TRAP transporter small permease [Natranaerovirga hydrolytica]TCK98595.1 TRAP-type C4-dicarboxylate transport system permease small subunit [Natranaerovirga hydrolytica]
MTVLLKIKKGADKIHKFMIYMAMFFLIAMTVLTCIQVFYRYFLGSSIRWSEEVPLILMVWFGFISIAMGVKKKLHISIELFFNLFPSKVRKILLVFVDIMILLFGIFMLIYGYKLTMATMGSTLPVTKLPGGIIYAVVPVTSIMIIYDSLMFLIGVNDEDDMEETQIEEILEEIGGEN